ncbi:MAG: BACON domain-containing protein [Bacteroidales bacterium]|nr:BACON domain-containing protein [Bacteroidales bacterium]
MKKILFAVAVAALALVSCKRDEGTKDSISLAPGALTEVYVSNEGISHPIPFTANVAWTAKADADWLTIDPASGAAGDQTIKVAVAANAAETDRSAAVTITAGTASVKVTINQSGAPFFEIDTESITDQDVLGEGGIITLPIRTNYTANMYSVELLDYESGEPIDWMSYDHSSLSVKVNAKDANDFYARYGVVTITWGEGEEETISFTVNQYYAQTAATFTALGLSKDGEVHPTLASYNGDIIVSDGVGNVVKVSADLTNPEPFTVEGIENVSVVINDDEGNLVLVSARGFDGADYYGSFKVVAVKADGTASVIVEDPAEWFAGKAPCGRSVSVRGDVFGNGAIAVVNEGWAGISGNNTVRLFDVKDGQVTEKDPVAVSGIGLPNWGEGWENYWAHVLNNIPGVALVSADVADGFYLSLYAQNDITLVRPGEDNMVVIAQIGSGWGYNYGNIKSVSTPVGDKLLINTTSFFSYFFPEYYIHNISSLSGAAIDDTTASAEFVYTGSCSFVMWDEVEPAASKGDMLFIYNGDSADVYAIDSYWNTLEKVHCVLPK